MDSARSRTDNGAGGDEAERLAALYRLKILDTPAEERFDRVTQIAMRTCGAAMAWMAFLDDRRQWFKSRCGLDMAGSPREHALCDYTIWQDELLVIPDTKADPRFRDNPLVNGEPWIRSYLGRAISTVDGNPVGTFCVADRRPREFSPPELEIFSDLASIAEDFVRLLDAVELQQELVKTRQELQQSRDLLREAFGCYVSDEVAESVLNSPAARRLGGQQCKVTVLFSDLRGFTPLSRERTPEQIVAQLNRYFTAMVEVIRSHDGVVDSFIGDAILAVFGAPASREDDAARAVACAVAMQNRLEELNTEFDSEGIPELRAGIGLNTGPVVAGNIGSPRRMHYSVIGDTVNLAARIESMTLGGQVLASASTVQEVEDLVRIDGQLRVKLKGVDVPVFIYDVSGIGGPHAQFTDRRDGTSTLEFSLPENGSIAYDS